MLFFSASDCELCAAGSSGLIVPESQFFGNSPETFQPGSCPKFHFRERQDGIGAAELRAPSLGG
jgi:hypothetical protein